MAIVLMSHFFGIHLSLITILPDRGDALMSTGVSTSLGL